jgi:N-acetylglucosaminyl-diphospho-decaprenol L-rhamnosyltransferase
MNKLAVIIVNYNVMFYLEQCLTSLQRALVDIPSEIYVVDNHSRDGSVEYLSRKFPEVNFVSSNHNLGFARANNIAIRQSESEYALFLNPDTIVAENTLHDTLSFMDEHPKAGGLGVKMLHTDGTLAMESRRGLPSPMTSFYKMCGLCKHYPQSHRFGHYYMSYLSWDEPAQIEVISGAFFLARRAALQEVGSLDEDFFMYGEDIDLSFRLLKGGFQNWYYPTPILHYKGESTQHSSFRYVHVFYEAMLIFFRKHYGNMSFLLSFPIKLAICMKASVALIQMQMNRLRRSLGFFNPHHVKEPLYIFFGERQGVDMCRQIVRKKGLDAIFVEGEHKALVEGHLGIELPNREHIYAVYDIHTFSFEEIFKIFARHPLPNVNIGTFNRKTRTVITAEEILK